MIDFLNDLLQKTNNPIIDLSYKNPELLGKTKKDRKSIFDVYCTAQDGSHFIVELQRAKQDFFKQRALYYASQVIVSQAQKGKWDYHFSPVVIVCILDFEFDDNLPQNFNNNLVVNNENYISHVQLIENKSKSVFCSDLEFYYIEIPKFLKLAPELKTNLDYWLFYFKNMENLTKNAVQNTKFERFLDECEIANLSTKERQKYDESLKIYRDWYAFEQTFLKQGEKTGIEKGEKIGIEKGEKIGIEKGENIGIKITLQIIQLIKEGKTDEEISEITGKSIETVKNIRDSL